MTTKKIGISTLLGLVYMIAAEFIGFEATAIYLLGFIVGFLIFKEEE